MQRTITADGKVYVEGGSEYFWGKALVYELNNRQELYAFTTNGDIACTNNIAERQIRPCVIHRGMMQFLQKEDSFRGYVDIMTIIQTCKLNKINPYNYTQWVIDNCKLRIEQYRCTGKLEGTALLCKMPRTQVDYEGKRIMAGPIEAVEAHCDNYVVIKPGFTKKEAIAKKIISKINEDDLLTLDDIIRVLPSGKCDIDEEYHQRKKI